MLFVHPLTVGTNGEPAYTADMFRRTENVWASPADRSVTFSSTAIAGIRNELDGPSCRYDTASQTVRVYPHSGVMYPFNGGSPYMYYINGEGVPIKDPAAKYKIAIEVVDPTAGSGATLQPDAKLAAEPATMPDANIRGIVLAIYDNGVINDIVPRLISGTIIQTNTLDQLKGIKTTQGQRGRVVSTGLDYIFTNGTWVAQNQFEIIKGKVTYTESPSKLNIDRLEKYGQVVHMVGNINDNNSAPNAFTYGTVPVGFRPTGVVHLTEGATGGINGAVGDTGVIRFQSSRPFGCWIDSCWITKE